MVLYQAASSYYSMIARLALHEAEVDFESHVVDIHFAKQQFTPWYRALNPNMTVPTLVDGKKILTDSHDILRYAATHAGLNWLDANDSSRAQIESTVNAFYAIDIENITFGKLMAKFPPLHVMFPKLLSKIIKKLNDQLSSCTDPDAVLAKIALNQQRLAYFTEGNLSEKIDIEREHIARFLHMLPKPASQSLLYGDQISSADVVCGVLLGRLAMIDELALLKPFPDLDAWFTRLQTRPAFAKADIWLKFHLLRVLRRR
jgi:glutathione S-transferase